jgi:hypothetical protein
VTSALLALLLTADGGAVTRDTVQQLVDDALAEVGRVGGERLVARPAGFASDDRRFVDFSLVLISDAPAAWQATETTLAGFHDLQLRLDRTHLQRGALPSADQLRERVTALQRRRLAALTLLQRAGQLPCEPTRIDARLIAPSGRNDFWQLDVTCPALTEPLSVEVEEVGGDVRVRAGAQTRAWLDDTERRVREALPSLKAVKPSFAAATLSRHEARMVNAARRPVSSIEVNGEAGPTRFSVLVTEPLDAIPPGASATAWETLPHRDHERALRRSTPRAMAWLRATNLTEPEFRALADLLKPALDACLAP